MTHPRTDEYLDQLRGELDLRDAREEEIDEIVRETRSHLVESGEDPFEAFGSPRDYAKQYAPSTTRFWVLIIVTVLLTIGGGTLLVSGLIGATGERGFPWGVDPVTGIAVGALLIAIWIVVLTLEVRRRKRR